MLREIAESYYNISERLGTLKDEILHRKLGDSWRVREAELLEWMLETEKELAEKARAIIS